MREKLTGEHRALALARAHMRLADRIGDKRAGEARADLPPSDQPRHTRRDSRRLLRFWREENERP